MHTTSKNESTYKFSGIKTLTGRALHNESGIAMVTALLLMVVMVSLVPVAMHLTSGEMKRAGDFKENREAFFLAEAGLEHAKFLTEASSMRSALAGPDDFVSATTSDPLNDNDNGIFNVGTQTPLNGFQYSAVPFNGDTYYIRAYDNDDGDPNFDTDNMIFLSAVGIVDNITTTVEALVYNPPGIPVGAVTTNGPLQVSGNANVAGACGGVHSNDDLTLAGTPIVAQDATATGSYTPGGTAGPGSAGGQPVIPIPILDVTALEPYADFTLDQFGNVYDASGAFVSSSPWNGWSHDGVSLWSKGSPTAVDAFLYIEGNAQVAGNAGSPGNPWNITVVATGYIKVSGSLTIANLKNPSHPVDIQNLFLVAGTDVEYNGNATQFIDGIIYATDQLKLTGTADINGAALAADVATLEPLVSSNLVSGTVDITYGCGLTIPSTTVIIDVVAWNEI